MMLKTFPTKKMKECLAGLSLVACLGQTITTQPVYAQKVDLGFPCQRFPSDPRCGGQVPSDQPERTRTGQPERVQEKKPLEQKSSQVIKVRLKTSGPDNEWVRFEMSNNGAGQMNLSAYHTTRVRRTLLSELARGLIDFGTAELLNTAIDGYNGPGIPVPINFHRWADHETRRLTFRPDGCSDDASISNSIQPTEQSSCVISGTKTLVLPAETDIRAGQFTLEYQEEELIRSITFRIPPQDRSQ